MAGENSTPVISLINTAYNGRDNLSDFIARVHKALGLYQYELIIIGDNSLDGTSELIEGLSHQYPVKLVHCEDNRSLSSAVTAGLTEARGEILGVMDAALQHPPEKIPELIKEIEKGADIAVASRYIHGGGIEGKSKGEKLISRGSVMLARLILPSVRKVKDPMSRFFLFKRKVIEGVVLKPRYIVLLQTLAGGGGEVKEVPHIEKTVGQKGALNIRERLGYLENILFLATKEKELRRFTKFCLVGLSGVAVNMGTFWLLTRVAGLYDLTALVFAIVASIISNFTLNDTWTFRDRRLGNIKATSVRALKFYLISLGAIALYYAIYTPLTRFWLGEGSFLALAIAIGVGVIWNFGMNILWTWRESDTETVTNP